MSGKYGFLSDAPLWIHAPRGNPPPMSQLRDVARALDIVVLFHPDCRDYLRELMARLRPLAPGADAPYLQPIPEEQAEMILARPFSSRTDEELRDLAIERLAANPVAINQLFEALAASPLPEEWQEIHDRECDRVARRDGIGWVDDHAMAVRLGLMSDSLDTASAGAARGAAAEPMKPPLSPKVLESIQAGERLVEERTRVLGPDHPDTLRARDDLAESNLAAGRVREALEHWSGLLRDRTRLLGPDHPDTRHTRERRDGCSSGRLILLRIEGTDTQRIEWKTGSPGDAPSSHLTIRIDVQSPDRLAVQTGGMGYVEPGCSLYLRWLTTSGEVNAEGSVRDVDTEVVLDNATAKAPRRLLPSHVLEVTFTRTESPVYSLVARVPIRRS